MQLSQFIAKESGMDFIVVPQDSILEIEVNYQIPTIRQKKKLNMSLLLSKKDIALNSYNKNEMIHEKILLIENQDDFEKKISL